MYRRTSPGCPATSPASGLRLRAVEIGINKRRAGDASDLALYTEFESWSALQAYEVHPLHEELKRLIGPLRVERRVVDYEVG